MPVSNSSAADREFTLLRFTFPILHFNPAEDEFCGLLMCTIYHVSEATMFVEADHQSQTHQFHFVIGISLSYRRTCRIVPSSALSF